MCYLPSHTVNGQACIAYCFVTIPSVDAILSRLNLSLISGRVAIANGALSQGNLTYDILYMCVCVCVCILIYNFVLQVMHFSSQPLIC
jgi:hypothetical protein